MPLDLLQKFFATEVAEKERVLRGFPQRSLCTLWLLMQEVIKPSPPSGGEQHSPSDGCGWGVVIV